MTRSRCDAKDEKIEEVEEVEKRYVTSPRASKPENGKMANDKLQSMAHHIIHECSDHPGQLGTTRLSTALWYADVTAFKMNGIPITEETYVKRQQGPMPKHILQTLKALEEEDAITILEPEYPFDTRWLVARATPASNALSDEERSIASAAVRAVLGQTESTISEMSHDATWRAAAEGEEIPLYATLAGRNGTITEAVTHWAFGEMAQRETA